MIKPNHKSVDVGNLSLTYCNNNYLSILPVMSLLKTPLMPKYTFVLYYSEKS